MPRLLRHVVFLMALAALTAGCQAEKTAPGRSAAPVAGGTGGEAVSSASPLTGAKQLILVVSDGWNTNQGRLRRYERAGSGSWKPVGDDLPVTLGRNGMAWGRGIHGAALGPGPVKVEGDGRSPAGVFTFSTAFAYRPEDMWTPSKMPMHRVTDQTVCVESIDSASYNRILDENTVATKDWQNPDRMLRPDGLYRYGLFVDHNAPQTKPGAGSCIFMHIWRRPGAPTAGCTAMTQTSIQVILAWMDAAKHPVLVQLPREELARLAPAWNAPELLTPAKRSDE